VITLDPAGLQQAAGDGLIQPIESALGELSEQEWHPFAVQSAQVEDQVFGIPFASDAHVFSYRTGLYPSTPETWSDLLESSSSFLIAAGDPQATFTVAQYLALEGEFTDSEGNPVLDPGKLSAVLSFYESSEFAGRLPLYSLQYESAEETWTALQGKQGGSAEAPLNLFLDQAERESETMVPIPTRDGAGIALSDTWSLAVTSADPFRLQAVKALLNWLLDPEFQGQWSRSLGMIPADPLAVDYWPEADAALVRPIILTTRSAPDEEVFTLFGPIFQRAVEDVLVGNASPEEAALDAMQSMNQQ
jgi:ABC-type glycerol-3-phosphate transport system substrate-binding protein